MKTRGKAILSIRGGRAKTTFIIVEASIAIPGCVSGHFLHSSFETVEAKMKSLIIFLILGIVAQAYADTVDRQGKN